MDLSTTYLGMRLPHPLIVGAGPLCDELDRVKELEDAGAALLVLRSLYEEEITGEQMDEFFNSESHSDSFAEAETFAPEPELWRSDPTSTSSICAGSRPPSAFR